jgi:hypothetical protein
MRSNAQRRGSVLSLRPDGMWSANAVRATRGWRCRQEPSSVESPPALLDPEFEVQFVRPKPLTEYQRRFLQKFDVKYDNNVYPRPSATVRQAKRGAVPPEAEELRGLAGGSPCSKNLHNSQVVPAPAEGNEPGRRYALRRHMTPQQALKSTYCYDGAGTGLVGSRLVSKVWRVAPRAFCSVRGSGQRATSNKRDSGHPRAKFFRRSSKMPPAAPFALRL